MCISVSLWDASDLKSTRDSGWILCVNGKPIPCAHSDFDKRFDPQITECQLVHEQIHADDATKLGLCTKCNDTFRPKPPDPKQLIDSECRAYRAQVECLAKYLNMDADKRPIGWTTLVESIEYWIKQHPGACPKQFPEDRINWPTQ